MTVVLAVVGTGAAALGAATGMFVALWRLQRAGFDAMQKQFETESTQLTEQLKAVDTRLTEQLKAVDTRLTEQLKAEGARWAERFDTMGKRFETAEKHNEAAYATICQRIDKLEQRTHADADAFNGRLDALNGRLDERFDALNGRFDERFDALNGRFDQLYRHLTGPGAGTGQPGPAAEG